MWKQLKSSKKKDIEVDEGERNLFSVHKSWSQKAESDLKLRWVSECNKLQASDHWGLKSCNFSGWRDGTFEEEYYVIRLTYIDT